MSDKAQTLPNSGPAPVCCYCDHDLSCDHCGMEQPYTDISSLKARNQVLEEALRFYRDEWRMNGDGDSETPGLSRSWMEPTKALFNDEGRNASAALKEKANDSCLSV